MQTQLDMLCERLPEQAVRWVPAENLHLTLKFLGDVPENALDAIKAATRTATQDLRAFKLTAAGLGYFPDSKRPRVIWVGLRDSDEGLNTLRDRVEQHIAPLGYPTENRTFHPHLTLGRVKTTHPQTLKTIGDVVKNADIGEIADWTCDAVDIMQSTLHPTGAVYRSFAHYAF